MKKSILILIVITSFVNVIYGQNKIAEYCFGNGATNSTNSNTSSLFVVGQSVIGVASNTNNKAFFGLIPTIRYIYTEATSFDNGENELMQNYPNPFRERTTISFILSKPSTVNLSVFGTLGETVTVLLNKKQMVQGKYDVVFSPSAAVSGIFFYRLKTDNQVITKTMIISK